MQRSLFLSGTLLTAFALSGCGHRYFALRTTNPVIEDRVRAGGTDRPKMSIVSTRADRRTILILDIDKICAEPPPDVAEAVASQAVARLSTQNIGAGVGTSLQTALLQLAQRSQGLEYFRTASFVYCNMYVINRSISRQQYNWYMAQAAAEAAKLMALQIEKNNLPGALGTVQVTNPQTVNVDAKTLEPKPADQAAGAPTPAPAETNKNPVPTEGGDTNNPPETGSNPPPPPVPGGNPPPNPPNPPPDQR